MTNKEIAWEKWEDDIVEEIRREDSKIESLDEDGLEESFLEAIENLPMQEVPKVIPIHQEPPEFHLRNEPRETVHPNNVAGKTTNLEVCN